MLPQKVYVCHFSDTPFDDDVSGFGYHTVVGAALIKKYSSYRTKQNKIHVFFPQNRSSGT